MLITLQSHNEVLAYIKAQTSATPTDSRTPVLSISPQTLASLSASISANSGQPPLPLLTLLRRIRSFLSRPENGGWRVWDTTFSRHLSLRETRIEYEQRSKGKGKEKASLPILASACPGWVCYAEKAQGDLLPLLSNVRSSQGIMGALVKQWWAGKMGIQPDQVYHVTAMPCYDKKLEASRSDFYNSVHSTRDTDCVLTTGELDLLLQDLRFDPLIPCSLETTSSRQPSAALDDRSSAPWPELLNHAGSSSGSYLSTIITHMSSNHQNPTRVITREIRGSADNVEYLLEDTVTGEVIFKGSKCYGFRNLQNLVRKVGKETGIGKGAKGAGKLSAAVAARRRKARTGTGGTGELSTPATGTATPTPAATNGEPTNESLNLKLAMGRDEKKLDFVEVMACPSGCVNGGGQMKPVSAKRKAEMVVVVDEEGYERPIADEGVDTGPMVEEEMRWSTKDWVAKVEEIYWSGLPTPPGSPSLESPPAASGPSGLGEQRLGWADKMAEEIVKEACGDDYSKKWNFLRCGFAKVEGDVLGGEGGVTHEAVVW